VTRIVALTGGIGSGKSTVARMLAERGATVIDADAIVHELQALGSPVLDELAAAFGPGILDASGALDRAALGGIVFSDDEARERLNAIMHPKVGVEFAARLKSAVDANAPLVVLDIPLLFESRRSGRGGASAVDFEAIVLVYVPVEIQIERQISRDACDRAQASSRIEAQMPIEDKKALADIVIDNTGTLEETEVQVKDVYDRLVGRAGASA
jgi:dephospho-CoA kinase